MSFQSCSLSGSTLPFQPSSWRGGCAGLAEGRSGAPGRRWRASHWVRRRRRWQSGRWSTRDDRRLQVLRPDAAENLSLGRSPISGRTGLRSGRASLVWPGSLVCSCGCCRNPAVLAWSGGWRVEAKLRCLRHRVEGDTSPQKGCCRATLGCCAGTIVE